MKRLNGPWTTVTTAILSAVLITGVWCTAAVGTAHAEDGNRKAKSTTKPVYPELARRMNITGTVRVEIVVDQSGSVKNVKALGGHPLLIQSATDAAKKWKYEPSSSESTEVVEFRFSPGM